MRNLAKELNNSMNNMKYKSKKDKNKEHALLKANKARLEENPKVALYLKWVGLSTMEKRTAYVVWDEYYKKVRETRAYSMSREMADAVKNKDASKIAELKKEGYAMRQEQLEGRLELPLPDLINPYDFSQQHSVSRYKWICNELKRLGQESLDLETSGIF